MAVAGDPSGLYQVLGVPRGASPDEIRSAFRERAKLYHPDVGSDADDERFRTLREAYDVLRDPQRRLQYDAESLDAERQRERARFQAFVSRGSAGLTRSLAGHPPVLVIGVAGALILTSLLTGTLAFQGAREAARLRQEVARLETELREAREVPPPRAGGAGEGGEVVYASALSFPSGSAELVGEFQASVDREMRELLPAVAGLPEAAGWRLQVDSYSGQAASAAGIAIDAWELALLRVASVTEYLIQAGVPPERIAVRFLAGFAGHEGAAGNGSDLELKLICCEL
jgi:hypothetical protein